MKRTWLLTLALWPLGQGCGGSPPPQFRARAQRPEPAVQGSAADFAPLVAQSAQVPRCEDLRDVPAALGSRVLSYIFGNPQEQRIALSLAEDGSILRYSDMRGSGTTPDGTENDLTAISIDFERGHAIALNRPRDGASEAVRFEMDDALDARSLGEPRNRMAEILAKCGG